MFRKQVLSKIYIIILAFIIIILQIICQTRVFATETGLTKNPIVVSLGDSYSSGEGIEPFYGQSLPLTEKIKNYDWLAHRSEKAWAGMLSFPTLEGTLTDYRNQNWYFVASSGATTKDIISTQEKKYNKSQFSFSKVMPNLQGTVSFPSQINIFENLKKIGKQADYVTLTIGGNDVNFTQIVTDAVRSSTYLTPSYLTDKINSTWKDFYEGGIKENIGKTYKEIHDKAGEQAQILVVGYPKLLSQKGSKILFSSEAAKNLNSAVSLFNDALNAIVDDYRIRYGYNIWFISVEEIFEGHGAYSQNPYLNGVILMPQSQDIKDTDIVSAYSMHPNYKGACAYAECVQAKINELEGVISESSNDQYNTNLKLSVYDNNHTLYDNYTVDITGTYNTGLFGWIKKEYNARYVVTDSKTRSIMLKDNGNYVITITDNNDQTKSYSKNIKVSKNYVNQRIEFSTNFGLQSKPDESVVYENTSQTEQDKKGDASSNMRDIVLVLDVSGSMSGESMVETKKASINFIDTILDEDANIGIVTYENSASVVSDFSRNKDALHTNVSDINDGGGTNIEAGLKQARDMLNTNNAKKKIIVLMSDGEPNDGREGTELIDYANEIKNDGIVIYTLGFFENLGDDKSYAQDLMEGIASDGCHYEVANADDLVFFFGDVADQINGQKYIYIRVACPVEVTVTYMGETLCSSEDSLNMRTDFGTLTFEDNANVTDSSDDNRIKVLRLKEGADYDVQIVGTGHGIMNYTIGFMNQNGDYSDLRKFEDIKITKKTRIDTVATVSKESVLNIDKNGDGKYDLRLRAEENGYGEEVNDFPLIYIIMGSSILVFLMVFIFIRQIKRKRKKQKQFL